MTEVEVEWGCMEKSGRRVPTRAWSSVGEGASATARLQLEAEDSGCEDQRRALVQSVAMVLLRSVDGERDVIRRMTTPHGHES